MPLEERRTIGPFIIYERRPKLRGETKYTVGKIGEAELHDFGRYSTACRWAKQQMPRPVPYLVINADTKHAVSTMPVSYTILDGDHVFHSAALVDPERVEAIMGILPTT